MGGGLRAGAENRAVNGSAKHLIQSLRKLGKSTPIPKQNPIAKVVIHFPSRATTPSGPGRPIALAKTVGDTFTIGIVVSTIEVAL
jgi:hypothetical protein